MNRALIIALSLGVLMLCSVGAFAGDPLKATIPFQFYAGNEPLPAGEYIFKIGTSRGLDSNFIFVQKLDGSDSWFVASIPGEKNFRGSEYRVTFTKYGDTYFLSRVASGNSEASVLKSRSERRMALLKGSRVPVVASLLKEK